MKAWFTRHAQTLVGTLGRLAQAPLANGLTIVVIGIALALPASLHVLVSNVLAVSDQWARAIDVSVYLRQGTSSTQAEQVADRIRQRRDVAEVDLIDADAALDQFRQQSGFGAAVDALTENPLPHLLVVRPTEDFATAPHAAAIAEELRRVPEVDLVQLDTEWVSRLQAMLDAVRRGVLMAGMLLAIGVIVIVGNTIRLDIQNRRDEIEVTKLVGGSDAFVRRPFLYSGFWYGLGGGLVAWLIVVLVVALLAGPASRIAGLYGSDFRLRGLGLEASLWLLGTGIALGWLGSYLAATRHLRAIEPS
jgi:cell division transport system permease protein